MRILTYKGVPEDGHEKTRENMRKVFYVKADPSLQDHSLMLGKYSNISESMITTNNLEWDTS